MQTVTFNVSIGFFNEIDVEVDVSDKDYSKLQRYSRTYYGGDSDEGCCEFEECKELSGLYNRVIDSAYDEMANGAYDDAELVNEFCDGEYDFKKMRSALEGRYDLHVNWPESEEFEYVED